MTSTRHLRLLPLLLLSIPFLLAAGVNAAHIDMSHLDRAKTAQLELFRRKSNQEEIDALGKKYGKVLLCGYGATGVLNFYMYFSFSIVFPMYTILQLNTKTENAFIGWFRREVRGISDKDKEAKDAEDAKKKIPWWNWMNIAAVVFAMYGLVMNVRTYHKCKSYDEFEIISGILKYIIFSYAIQAPASFVIWWRSDHLPQDKQPEKQRKVRKYINMAMLYIKIGLGWFIYYYPLAKIKDLSDYKKNEYLHGLFVNTRALLAALLPVGLWFLICSFWTMKFTCKAICTCKWFSQIRMIVTFGLTVAAVALAAVACVRFGSIAGDPWGECVLDDAVGGLTAALTAISPLMATFLAFKVAR